MNKQNLYVELKEECQKKINEFNIKFAFDEEQLQRGMEELEVTSKKDIVLVGGNGFIKKNDVEKFKALFTSINKKKKEMLKNETYVYQMFYYELANHEYIISYDDEDVLEACDLSIEELKNNKALRSLYQKAKTKYFKDIEIKDNYLFAYLNQKYINFDYEEIEGYIYVLNKEYSQDVIKLTGENKYYDEWKGLYLVETEDSYFCVDNIHGNCWCEDFKNYSDALNWLKE